MDFDNILFARKLSGGGGGGGSLTPQAKQALLDCFAHVAWADSNGQSYYDALESALSGEPVVDNSLYNWDFTKSLTDSKKSTTATLGDNITQSANGLTFGTSSGEVSLANIGAYGETTVEIDFTTITHGATGNNTYLTFYSSSADYRRWVAWNNDNSIWRFRIFQGTWSAFSGDGVANFNQFSGHTMKIQIDPLLTYTVKLYCDNTLVGTATMDTKGTQNSTVVKLSGVNGTVITGCRIYEGMV